MRAAELLLSLWARFLFAWASSWGCGASTVLELGAQLGSPRLLDLGSRLVLYGAKAPGPGRIAWRCLPRTCERL